MVAHIPCFQPIAEARIIHSGGRSLARIVQSQATVIPAAAIHASGVQHALTPALQALAAQVQRVYLHVDVDVLDLVIAEAIGCAVPGGAHSPSEKSVR